MFKLTVTLFAIFTLTLGLPGDVSAEGQTCCSKGTVYKASIPLDEDNCQVTNDDNSTNIIKNYCYSEESCNLGTNTCTKNKPYSCTLSVDTTDVKIRPPDNNNNLFITIGNGVVGNTYTIIATDIQTQTTLTSWTIPYNSIGRATGVRIDKIGSYSLTATNGIQTCRVPQVRVSLAVVDPKCPNGLSSSWVCPTLCCQVKNGGCENLPGSPPIVINTCDNVKKYALLWKEKTVCDSGWGYDANQQACVYSGSGGGGTRAYAMPLLECINGVTSPNNNVDPAILSTAIGCVPVKDLGLFLQWVLGWLFGAAGAIIVLFLIKLGYDIVTSQGDPQKLQEVKESIISIFSGLILIVFSLVLLKTIGADILGLPGF